MPFPPCDTLSPYLDHAKFTLRQVSKLDLLDGHSLSRAPVEGLVDRAERSFADAVPETLESNNVSISAAHVQSPASK